MRVLRLECIRSEAGVFDAGIVAEAKYEYAKSRGAGDWYELEDAPPDPFRHDSPWGDVPGWDRHDDRASYVCAFKDMSQLLAWFDSEAIRVEMGKLGAVLREFEVDPADVMMGRSQVMFRKDRASLVDERPIPTLAH